MNIIRKNEKQSVEFKILSEGCVFIDPDTSLIYMKIESITSQIDDNDYEFNAVNLDDGTITLFKNEDIVLLPNKSFLTIE